MTQKNSNFEIIIVDGGSTDCTIDLIKQYPNSEGDIVVFLDDDAIAEKDWLESLVKPFEDEGIAGASGKVIPITNTLFNREFAPDYDQGPDIKDTKYFVGCNMAFRKSAIIEVGLFDTKIRYGHDENELCSRLLNAGYRLIYTPYAVAHHNYVSSFSALLKKKFKLGKSRAYLEKKSSNQSESKKRIIYFIPIPVALVVLSLGAMSFFFSVLKPYLWSSLVFAIGYVFLLTVVIKYRSNKSMIGAFLTIFTELARELGKIYGRLFSIKLN
jgi:GT2 family glycosyltransferase